LVIETATYGSHDPARKSDPDLRIRLTHRVSLWQILCRMNDKMQDTDRICPQ
jgi:hypothetical protein